jgi:diguanylate cyclase (GGDEF)-like protein
MRTAGIAAAVVAASIALAGVAVGPVAVVLALPAGVGGALLAGRVRARERRLRALALRDPLTGLGNRRALDERLAAEIARHRRHGRRFALVVMDLDGFKRVNDRFGHQAGDEILRDVAHAVRLAVREHDTVVRLGGDELCVLAPETGAEEAAALTERLRRAVREAVAGLDGLSVSAGWSIFPDDGGRADVLLAAADGAAMAAKRRAAARRAA